MLANLIQLIITSTVVECYRGLGTQNFSMVTKTCITLKMLNDSNWCQMSPCDFILLHFDFCA